MANKGILMSDSSLENIGGGKTIYEFDMGNNKEAPYELIGADGEVLGRYQSEEERSRALASMGADEVGNLKTWGDLNRLRKWF